jgi:high-affinity nickel-transport protein
LKGSIISLSRREKLIVIAIYSVLGIASLVSFILAAVMGQIYLALGGLGIMSFVLGLRHAVDADHIAAIDNTTRKLMQENKRPLTVGMWFSIGHSAVVFVMVIALVFASQAVVGTAFQNATGVFSTLISGTFLFFIGFINVIMVWDIYTIFTGLKNGTISQSELDCELNRKGFINKHFSGLFKIVRKPHQMFIVGFLFGLGFDTATEVLLIGLSISTGIPPAVPLWAILTLPLCFACGMIIADTTDGISMMLAYGWAFQHPIRRIYYNLTITIMSILVAFVIGGIELLQVVAREFDWTTGFFGWLVGLDFETLGFGIVALFIVSWLASVAYYRYRGYEMEFDRKFLRDVENCPPPGGLE